jgi:YggT family protein
VNVILCYLDTAVYYAAQIYVVVLLVYAIVSWIPDIRGPWVRYLGMFIEPLLMPIRRIIPPIGGLDIAFLVLLLIVQFLVIPLVTHAQGAACYASY